jgi:adenylate kinase
MMGTKRNAIIFLGTPGSGKTTVAEHLADDKCELIETGRLIQDQIRLDSESGRKLKPFVQSGKLAPTDLVNKIVEQKIKKSHASVILFDGYPRRKDQIDPFFDMSRHLELDLGAVIVLELSTNLAQKRLTGRRICSDCGAIYNLYFNPPSRRGRCDLCGGELQLRKDDKPEVVNRRLRVYQRDTQPVADYFNEVYAGITHLVKADKPVEQVADSVSSRLQESGLDCF